MSCYSCGAEAAHEILNKGPVPVWTDVSDAEGSGRSYPCVLLQCERCGHVYQPVDDELRALFDEIYSSSNAQGPSPMGAGDWGMERAQRLFFDHIDLGDHTTAAEIGCGDGYLLKALRARGFERLVGIEPSVNVETESIDGITFLNAFVHGGMRLDEKVDLIYSIAVFEHIEAINDVLTFCRLNLHDNGDLFFVVPNAEAQLENGDPGLFVHQHVHYFTRDSLAYVLERNGFECTAIEAGGDALYVKARPGRPGGVANVAGHVSYETYQAKLDRILGRLKKALESEDVIVHGACNALNNIAAWVGGEYRLVDSDANKQGKTYFGKVVTSPLDLDLTRHDRVVVVPNAFYDAISEAYLGRGFQGEIVGLMP
jgi:hypothetical protein